jgi:hypothetical protein
VNGGSGVKKEGGYIKVRSIERTTRQGEAGCGPTKTGCIGLYKRSLSGDRAPGTKAVKVSRVRNRVYKCVSKMLAFPPFVYV